MINTFYTRWYNIHSKIDVSKTYVVQISLDYSIAHKTILLGAVFDCDIRLFTQILSQLQLTIMFTISENGKKVLDGTTAYQIK